MVGAGSAPSQTSTPLVATSSARTSAGARSGWSPGVGGVLELSAMGGARAGGTGGQRGMRLLEIPAEGPIDQELDAHRPQQECQKPRRQRRDQALQARRARERRAVALVEGLVARQGLGPRLPAGEHRAQLAPAGDAEVERGADPLAREREA